MPGRKGLNGAHTRALHARRMGDTPLPTLREALKSDPEFRAKVKERVSEAAKAANKRESLIETRRERERERMTAPGMFLCGCDPTSEKIQTFRYELIWVNGSQVLTNQFFNKEGQLVCPIHGQPMYGYRSRQDPAAPYWSGRMQMPESTVTEDRRDLRDPSELGQEILDNPLVAPSRAENGDREASPAHLRPPLAPFPADPAPE